MPLRDYLGLWEVEEFWAKVYDVRCGYGLMLTTGQPTVDASAFARHHGIKLIAESDVDMAKKKMLIDVVTKGPVATT